MPHVHVQEHIELIARHEQEFLARRTVAERRVDAIAGFIGSIGFVAVHLALFTVWIAWNSLPGHLGLTHFDPRPYSLLQTCVAMESLLAASFILIRQTRLARRSEEREHLMLQISLLVEKEATALLNLQRQVAQQIGLERAANAPEMRELGKETPLEEVAQVIQQSLADAEHAESPPASTLGLSGELGEELK